MPRALSLRVNMTTHEDQSARFEDSSRFEDVELGDEHIRGSFSSEISTTSNENQASAGVSSQSEEDGASSSKSVAPIEEEPEQITLLQRIFSIKVLVGLLLAGFITFVIIDSTTTGHVREAVESFLDWIQENPVEGFFAFVVGKSAVLSLQISLPLHLPSIPFSAFFSEQSIWSPPSSSFLEPF